MKTIFIICIACLPLIPGLLLALLNWCNIGLWVWEKWRKPRKYVETCIVPFLGGMFLTAAFSILVLGLPEYSTPLLKDLGAVLGVKGAPLVVPLAGFLLDFGSIPNLIITPLLGFLFGLKQAPGRATPRGPYCREIQLPFPLILVGEDEIPQLICSPAGLPRMDADFCRRPPAAPCTARGSASGWCACTRSTSLPSGTACGTGMMRTSGRQRWNTPPPAPANPKSSSG